MPGLQHRMPSDGVPQPVPLGIRTRTVSGNSCLDSSIRESVRSMERENSSCVGENAAGEGPRLDRDASSGMAREASIVNQRSDSGIATSWDAGEDDSMGGGANGSAGRSRRRRNDR